MESKKNYGVVVNYHVEELKRFIDEYTQNWHNTPTPKLKIYLMGAIDGVTHLHPVTGAEYIELKEYAKRKIAELERIRETRVNDVTIL